MKYKAYPEYKESVIEWIGEIPKDWEVKKLKYIGKAIIGLTYSPNQIVSEYDNGVLVFRSSNIQEGKISYVDNVYVNMQISEKLYTKIGDILICSRNGSRNLIGKNALINENDANNSFGAFMTVFRSDYYYFLYYVLNSNIFEFQADSCMTTTVNQLTTGNLNNMEVPLPPLPEQIAISKFLDQETIRIKNIINAKKNLIEKLKEKRNAVISHAVTKGLDFGVKMKPSGIDWIGNIPSEWNIVPLTKYLSSIIDYRGKTPQKVDEGIFLVTARNIKNGIIDYELSKEFINEEDYEEVMSRGKPSLGDVLFTTEAPLGEVANVDNINIALAQRIIKFCGKKAVLNNYYLKYWLMSSVFQNSLQSLATGSTALGIKASKLHMLRLNLPPLDQQAAIVKYLDEETAKTDTIITKTKTSIEKLKEYQTALITAAVTGKIDVREEV